MPGQERPGAGAGSPASQLSAGHSQHLSCCQLHHDMGHDQRQTISMLFPMSCRTDTAHCCSSQVRVPLAVSWHMVMLLSVAGRSSDVSVPTAGGGFVEGLQQPPAHSLAGHSREGPGSCQDVSGEEASCCPGAYGPRSHAAVPCLLCSFKVHQFNKSGTNSSSNGLCAAPGALLMQPSCAVHSSISEVWRLLG